MELHNFSIKKSKYYLDDKELVGVNCLEYSEGKEMRSCGVLTLKLYVNAFPNIDQCPPTECPVCEAQKCLTELPRSYEEIEVNGQYYRPQHAEKKHT